MSNPPPIPPDNPGPPPIPGAASAAPPPIPAPGFSPVPPPYPSESPSLVYPPVVPPQSTPGRGTRGLLYGCLGLLVVAGILVAIGSVWAFKKAKGIGGNPEQFIAEMAVNCSGPRTGQRGQDRAGGGDSAQEVGRIDHLLI